jgi:hypothetical protein
LPRPTSKSLNLLDPALAEANRRGEIAPEQTAWLKSSTWGGTNRVARLGLVVVIVLLSVLFIFFALSTNLDRQFVLIMGLVIAGVLGVVLLPRILRAIRASTQLGSDLQGRLIRRAAGELAFNQGSYRVMAGDGALSLPASSNAGGLLPGVRYSFYYLEESRLVLSAEEYGTGSPAAVRKALAPILAVANRFADEDLQANRRPDLARRGIASWGRRLRRDFGVFRPLFARRLVPILLRQLA